MRSTLSMLLLSIFIILKYE